MMLKQICNIEQSSFELLKNRIWEDASTLPKEAVIIDMNPGLAFGTGTHQTTDLCLQYLDQNPPKNLTVIDYGTGTGVLAIAAAKLGEKEVIAIDNGPQAVLATTNNIQTNHVDLLIANILANPLVGLCEHFSRRIKSGGKIVLSGILQDQVEIILDTYGHYFLTLSVKQKGDWCCVDGIRKPQI
ncbi:50S ribosomal protein L11 methyltransferase [Isorropodon fossajaponicum symbiont]|uniref:50S ribosomal protein L11 methyltransferase n=1 Tax=Isorropodon fossajaponicum symbiont TaxID=883811 RepID=UPI0019151789|nr:50S ribosomal protein L11 methyltransferase [Isorropodon fossajaponicum symbiont]